jgi:hypothetical protein
MTEHVPDCRKRRALTLQLDGMSVAKRVAMHPPLDACPAGESGQEVPSIRWIDATSLQCADEWCTRSNTQPRSNLDPATDHRERTSIDANDSPLAPLASLDDHSAFVEVDVLRTEIESFTDAKAATPQEHDEGTVPNTRRRAPRTRPEQRLDVLPGQQVGLKRTTNS